MIEQPPRTSTRSSSTLLSFTTLSTMMDTSVVKVAVYFVIFGYLVMSVDAIRCHQCNSHLDESCASLDLQRAAKNSDYLKDCDPSPEGYQPFCRKIALSIEYNEDKRIIRSCGYRAHNNRTEKCFNADNEGYLERVCQCFTDGCNAATTMLNNQNLGLVVIVLLFGLISGFSINYVSFE